MTTRKLCLILLVLIAPGIACAHGVADDRLHRLDHDIRRNPHDPGLYVKRGRIHQDQAHWDAALKDYAKALRLDAGHHEALFWRGTTYMDRADYVRAAAALKEYLSRKPHAPAGHTAIARVYSRSGDHVAAADHYDQSVALDRKAPPQIYLERARTLLNIDPVPVERIESGLAAAVDRHGAIVTFLELLVEVNVRTANYREALGWIDRLPEPLKNSPAWLIKTADLEVLRENPADALRLYQTVVATISAMPEHKQRVAAHISAREKAEQKIESLLVKQSSPTARAY